MHTQKVMSSVPELEVLEVGEWSKGKQNRKERHENMKTDTAWPS
jgi:hypothetical protein